MSKYEEAVALGQGMRINLPKEMSQDISAHNPILSNGEWRRLGNEGFPIRVQEPQKAQIRDLLLSSKATTTPPSQRYYSTIFVFLKDLLP